MDEFEIELQAMQWVIRSDYSRIIYVTQRQIQGLNALLRQGLSTPEREKRIAIVKCLVGAEVRQITGIEITSTKNLTSPIASYLIEQLKEPNSTPWKLSEHGQWLLNEAERHI
jgi:hypothetical protein